MQFKLSVDEVAMALAQVGASDVGKQLLRTIADDELSDAELSARLLAAGHSLMARELLDVSESGVVTLNADLATVARALAEAPRTLRVSRVYGRREQTALYYESDDGEFVAQAVDREIVHTLSYPVSRDTVTELCERLIGASEAAHTELEWLLPLTALTDLDECETLDDAVELLTGFGLSHVDANQLANDVASASFRGSIATIGGDGDGAGSMVVGAGARLWMFDVVSSADGALRLRARSAVRGDVARRVRELMSEPVAA